MTTGEYIILGVYGIGYLITYFHQRNENKSLKSIMAEMKNYVSVFDAKKIKEMVDFWKETLTAQRDKAVEDIKAEASRSEEGNIAIVTNLVMFIDNLSRPFVNTTFLDEIIDEMKEGAAKNIIRRTIERNKELFRKHEINAERQSIMLRSIANSLSTGK